MKYLEYLLNEVLEKALNSEYKRFIKISCSCYVFAAIIDDDVKEVKVNEFTGRIYIDDKLNEEKLARKSCEFL